jgi:DNA polymerase V
VPAGFPSPADDYIEQTLDLNEFLIRHPAATFFVRVRGHSMINVGIFNNDLLVVDRSLEPCDGRVVLAVVNGEFTVKRLQKNRQGTFLHPENPAFSSIEIKPDTDFEIWGVVAHVIHSLSG